MGDEDGNGWMNECESFRVIYLRVTRLERKHGRPFVMENWLSNILCVDKTVHDFTINFGISDIVVPSSTVQKRRYIDTKGQKKQFV